MNVPVSLLIYSLQYKKISPLKLFLYLKQISSGHFHLCKESIEQVCTGLKWKSTKTFSNNIHWLVKHRWITVNNKTQSYRTISYRQLQKLLKLKIRTGVIMEREDFTYFRPFIYASVITWSMKRKKRTDKKSERKEGRSSKSFHPPKPYTLPNRYLAKILQLDSSTISRYKSHAAEAGYLIIHKRYEDTGLPAEQIHQLHKTIGEEADTMVVFGKRIYRQLPDRIDSFIHLRYKNQLKN
jgi:hypothetical protein